MSIEFSKLASKLGFTESEMKKRILEMGLDVQDEYDEELSTLIIDEVAGNTTDQKSAADLYGEIADEERDKEIIRSQRKQMAGKGSTRQKRSDAKSSVTGVKQGVVVIPEQISVKELAEKTGTSAAMLIGALMKNGILANINQVIDFETASILTEDFGIELKKEHQEASAEDIFHGNLENLLKEDDPSSLEDRPPVVCVMGHVDHGKTTLLDAIREANVVQSESGGITQHIGAYQVVKNKRPITFLDTPGHEAFTAMRARGARATDVAILVVAADDGVMPQTIEAINHAREANVPIIVAINKMDKPGITPDKIKAELAEHGLQPEEWGGDTIMVPVSALKKEGLGELLESVLLVSDVLELKANPHRPGVASIVESHLDPGLGPVATVLMNTGSLSIGDNFVIGGIYGRVKTMKNHLGKDLKKLGPSDTAQISGLSETVESGQILQVVKDEKSARQQASNVGSLIHEELIKTGMGMSEILQRIKEGSLKLLKVVIKADTQGSLEAIKQSLAKVKSDDVAIKVIHSGVGTISESDVMMAAASPGTLVIGFHSSISLQVERSAERLGIEVLNYEVIYKLIEDLTKILSGMLEPEIITTELGEFKVKKVFFTGKNEMVVGGVISKGIVESKANLRVIREDEEVGTGIVGGLKLVNEDMSVLEKGQECGLRFSGKLRLREGDVLQAWKQEKRIKTL